MWPNPRTPSDLVTFTEEILNGKSFFVQWGHDGNVVKLLFFEAGNIAISER